MKRLLAAAITVLVTLFPLSSAFAAIAFDATSEPTGGSFNNTALGASWTHTPVGTPTLVTVCGSGNATSLITDVKYGGVSIFANKVTQANTTANLYSFCYYSTSPLSGAQTVSVTTTSGGGSVWLSAQTYTGTGGIGNTNSGQDNTNASSLGISLTATAATSWFVQQGISNVSQPTSVTGGGATWAKRGVSQVNQGWDSNGTVTSGANTVTATWSGGQSGISMVALEILAAAASASAPSKSSQLILFGDW